MGDNQNEDYVECKLSVLITILSVLFNYYWLASGESESHISNMNIYETPEIKTINSIKIIRDNSNVTPKEEMKYDKDDIVMELKVLLAKVERDIKRHCN